MDTVDRNASHQRIAYADVLPGMQQSLGTSTQQVDRVNERFAEQTVQRALQAPTQEEPLRSAPKVA
jgi:hypothetical protein